MKKKEENTVGLIRKGTLDLVLRVSCGVTTAILSFIPIELTKKISLDTKDSTAIAFAMC